MASIDIATYEKQYIGGAWVESTNAGEFIDVLDSNTNTVFAKVIRGSTADTEKAIAAAEAAFPAWSQTSLDTRKGYLAAILGEYMKRQQEVADNLQKELGAPKGLAEKVQSMMFALHISTVLQLADSFEWSQQLDNSTVVKEPIGVVGCITPWNWPLNQIAAKLGPALLSGCTMVLKPSEMTPINAFIVAEAIHAAGLPAGVFNMVCGTGPECAEVLATHPKVDMVSFTGSTRVGRRLHALGAETIKRVRTELGGKSAAIILEDASKDQIALMASHVLGNTGQSCNALSRMLAPRARYEEVVAIAKERFEKVKVTETQTGGPADMGPLASQVQLGKVSAYIQKGIDEGARLVIGGPGCPDGVNPNGYFVKPTIFADVHNDMTIAKEEIFGPVLAIIPYDTEDEAIRIANDTVYGLNNAVAGVDEEHAMAVAAQLRSGQVHINTLNSGPLAPFGGYKQSGDGREWGSFGIEEFVQVKAITKPPSKSKSRL